MKAIIQELDTLTDSKELLEARPHPFTTIFIYIVIAIFVSAFTWTYFSQIDIVVKASGVIRPDEKINTIKNKVAGKVEELLLKDGQEVKKGEVLYTIEHEALKVQKAAVEENLTKQKGEYASLQKLKKSILERKNYFDEKTEKEYYNKYLKYETDYSKMNIELEKTELDMEELKKTSTVTEKFYSDEIEKLQVDLAGLQLLQKSIEEDKNYFHDTKDRYYNRFLDYNYTIEKYKALEKQNKEHYEKLNTLGEAYTPRTEIEKARKEYEDTVIDREKYQNEFRLSLKKEIADSIKALSELQVNRQKSNPNLEAYKNSQQNTQISVQKYEIDTLVEINNSLKELEKKIEDIENSLKATNISIEDAIVKAPMDGITNTLSEINKGDLLESGASIATIIPKNSTQYKVQLYVLNKDIADIKEGDKIKYHLLALPYKEYGELTGEITKIATDATVDEQGGLSFYRVEAEIENKPLYSYKGVKAEIKVGMAAEAHIITKRKKMLHYLLEKINLRD